MQKVLGWECKTCKLGWYSNIPWKENLIIYCPVCGKALERIPGTFKLEDAPPPRNTTIWIDDVTHKTLKEVSRETGKPISRLVSEFSKNLRARV